jgi:hypothetical protein
MVEAQRAGKGIKRKTEGRNGREGQVGKLEEVHKGDERRVIHEVLEWQGMDIFRVVSREKEEEKQAGSRT